MIKDFFDSNFEKYPRRLLVAVSGGVDSMALTFMLNDFCKESGVNLMAVTIDHSVRENSNVEAISVGNLMLEKRINHKILTVKDVPKANIEAVLRKSRYDLLCDFAKENGVDYVFTGHHKNDQAENFLIRLFRGSQLDGLSGMDEVTDFDGIKICRPLLNVQKEELVDYLKERDITWFEDESNADERFLRNKIRNFLATFEEKDVICDRITRFSEIVRESRDLQDEEVLKEVKKVLIFVNNNSFLINLGKYRKINNKIALKILSLAMMEVSQKGYKPRLEGLERFEKDILKLEKSKKRDFYGCQAKLLTKSNYDQVIKVVVEVEKQEIISNPSDFLWIYPLEGSGGFRFRTILGGLFDVCKKS